MSLVFRMDFCYIDAGLNSGGVCVGILTHFSVQTANAGTGPLAVGLFNPKGQAELVRNGVCHKKSLPLLPIVNKPVMLSQTKTQKLS